MQTTTQERSPLALREAWDQVRRTQKLRARDAARALGVSEGELVASEVGTSTTRLAGDPREIMKRVPELGTVMALTRNEHCVHEKVGPYLDVSANGMVGLVLGELIDLRVFFMHWAHTFAVTTTTPHGEQRSLQFFDKHGDAVHKIIQRAETDLTAWDRLVADFRSEDQAPGITTEPRPAPAAEKPDAEIDVAGFRTAWSAMTDTHEFFPLLKKFKVARTQALRLADPQFARPVSTDAFAWTMHTVRDSGVPIMVFVGNPGMIQIHTGPISNIKVMDRWFNVMDPDFNLHMQEPSIASAWVVRKPTADGIVTSLELFDTSGENIALIFGKRKPGIPESEAWREVVAQIATSEPAAA